VVAWVEQNRFGGTTYRIDRLPHFFGVEHCPKTWFLLETTNRTKRDRCLSATEVPVTSCVFESLSFHSGELASTFRVIAWRIEEGRSVRDLAREDVWLIG